MTKLAVIADIHANYAALEAAQSLLDSLSPDGVIFLGDFVTDFPEPRRTLAMVREIGARYPTWMVRGNREDYLLSHRASLRRGRDDGWVLGSSTGSLLYTYNELTEEDLDFLERLPVTANVALPESPELPLITACHATPFATKDWIMGSETKLKKCLAAVPGELLLCGHTHRTAYYGFPEGRVLVCPSLGNPQDPGIDAGMTLLIGKNGAWRHRFLRVAYDKEQFIREVEQSRLMEAAPIWSKALVKSLRDGGDYPVRCVKRAYCLAKLGHHARPMDEYWEQAARELGIL